jgi:hypothetical protein
VLVNYIDRINLSVAAGPLRKDMGLSAIELGYVFSAFRGPTLSACCRSDGWSIAGA